MGRPKLLLPWGDGTVIDRVLSAWTCSAADQVIVVARREDTALHRACLRWPVVLVTPERDPADMKASVQAGLAHLTGRHTPRPDDYCCIAPADTPTLSATLINRLIDVARKGPTDNPPPLVVPRFGDRRGHPILLPWRVTAEIWELGEDEGIHLLLDRHPRCEVPLPAQLRVPDMNTPEQYAQLLDKLGTTEADSPTGRRRD